MTLTFIKGQFLGLSSPCCPYVRKNLLPIAIRLSGCGHGSGFMETMIQIKTQSESVYYGCGSTYGCTDVMETQLKGRKLTPNRGET